MSLSELWRKNYRIAYLSLKLIFLRGMGLNAFPWKILTLCRTVIRKRPAPSLNFIFRCTYFPSCSCNWCFFRDRFFFLSTILAPSLHVACLIRTETYNVFQTYEHIIYLILIRHRNINVVVSHQVRSFHNCFLEKHHKNASEENLRNCCSHNVSVLLITVWFLV